MKKLLSFATVAVAVLSLCGVAEAATDNATFGQFKGGTALQADRIQWGFVAETGTNINSSKSVNVTSDITSNDPYGSYTFSSQVGTTSGSLIIGATVVEPWLTGNPSATITGFNGSKSQSTAPTTGILTVNITAYSAYDGQYLTMPQGSSIDGTDVTFSNALTTVYFLVEWSSTGTRNLVNFTITLGDHLEYAPTSTPEPSTLAVFGGIAALGFVAIRRKRKIAA